jgi:hypothetical protein
MTHYIADVAVFGYMRGCKQRPTGARETHHSDKRGQSGEDAGLLHYAGAGVREDQRGVSEGCAAIRAVSIDNASHTATIVIQHKRKNRCCIELSQQLSEYESRSNQTVCPDACAGW